MMKTTFVFPDLNVFQECSRDYSGIFAHGIGYLSAMLKKNGQQVSLIHLVREADKAAFLTKVDKEKPDLIAFTSFSHQFEYIKRLSGWLKERHNIPVICGGTHATINPEEVIEADGIDMLCRGEGEYALAEICHKLSCGEDISGVKNVWLKKDGYLIKNGVRPLEDNLDDFLFPDRRLFSYHSLYDYKIRMLTILASRGCPYNCSYCCNHQYQRLYPSNYVRFRSVDNVLEEIAEALTWYPDIEFINFIDDTLCLNKKWMEEFCHKFPKRFAFPFHGNTRIELLDEDMLALLKKGRCERLDVGIESGNSYIREKILNRKISEKRIYQIFDLARQYGIKLATYNMIGYPFENPEMILETIKLNVRLRPFAVNRSILQPYPNTDIYKICMENNFIFKKEVSSFYKESVLEQPQLSCQQVVFFHRYFPVLLKLYGFFEIWPLALSRRVLRFVDRGCVYLSKNFLVLKLDFLVLAIFMPVSAAKQMLVRAMPGLARKLKYVICRRHYMRGRLSNKSC